MKHLDPEELFQLAEDLRKQPGCDIGEKFIAMAQRQMEEGMDILAEAIADRLGIVNRGTSLQIGFGGLCSTFCAKEEGQPLPDALKPYDPGGDWEPLPDHLKDREGGGAPVGEGE